MEICAKKNPIVLQFFPLQIFEKLNGRLIIKVPIRIELFLFKRDQVHLPIPANIA